VTAASGSGDWASIDGTWFDWSPDGSQLVVSAPGAQIDGSPYRKSAVYVVDADGSNRRWLADGDHPQWSP
jgi:Tol biopolymer transport system component